MYAYVLVLGSRIKKIVQVEKIKKFVLEKHVPTQKYKLDEEPFLTQCIILFMAETEMELQALIKCNRSRAPANKLLQSAAETTDDEEISIINRKRQVKEDDTDFALKKRLRVLKSSRANDLFMQVEDEQDAEPTHTSIADKTRFKHKVINKENIGTTPSQLPKFTSELIVDSKTYDNMKSNMNSLKEKMSSLAEEVKRLRDELSEKDEELIDKTTVITALEDELRRKEEELHNVRALNVEWQKTAVEKYNNLIAIHKATVESPSTSHGGGQHPPIGYITEDESQIHIGLYLSTQAWSLALHVPNNRHITFAKNILVALCGYDYLSNTTVSGKGSNRNRQTKIPKKQLDPKVILAVRDIYSYYLVNEKKFKEEEADLAAAKVFTHISKKIAQIKETKIKAYKPKPQREVLGNRGDDDSENSAEPIESDFLIDVGNEQKIPLSELEDDAFLNPESDEEIAGDNSAELTQDRMDTTDQISSDKEEEELRRILNGGTESEEPIQE